MKNENILSKSEYKELEDFYEVSMGMMLVPLDKQGFITPETESFFMSFCGTSVIYFWLQNHYNIKSLTEKDKDYSGKLRTLLVFSSILFGEIHSRYYKKAFPLTGTSTISEKDFIFQVNHVIIFGKYNEPHKIHIKNISQSQFETFKNLKEVLIEYDKETLSGVIHLYNTPDDNPYTFEELEMFGTSKPPKRKNLFNNNFFEQDFTQTCLRVKNFFDIQFTSQEQE